MQVAIVVLLALVPHSLQRKTWCVGFAAYPLVRTRTYGAWLADHKELKWVGVVKRRRFFFVISNLPTGGEKRELRVGSGYAHASCKSFARNRGPVRGVLPFSIAKWLQRKKAFFKLVSTINWM